VHKNTVPEERVRKKRRVLWVLLEQDARCTVVDVEARKGEAQDDGYPKDVDREFVTMKGAEASNASVPSSYPYSLNVLE
jgi:hypothetical protein